MKSLSLVSDSWRPHGLQPTRLLRPWDFPGKSTGVGCHCLLLYTNNEKTEREIKETIPFTIAMKIIKYLGIYLAKETKDIYVENYKTWVKEIKEDIIGGEIYHVH